MTTFNVENYTQPEILAIFRWSRSPRRSSFRHRKDPSPDDDRLQRHVRLPQQDRQAGIGWNVQKRP